MSTTSPGSAVDVSGKPSAAELETHGNHAGIKRHRRAHQPLCDACREYQRLYNRTYYRQARDLEPFRRRHNAQHRDYMRRLYADPATVASLNARRRERRRQELEAAAQTARIDEVVVDRLVNGQLTTYNRAERLEAVRLLRDRGLAYRQIAERLHIEDRQVHRDLTALGLVAVAS